MMTLAKAVGIDVPDVRLVGTKDIERLPQDLPEAFGQSLAVRRFDLWPTHEPLRAIPERIRDAITAHLATVPL